MSQVAIIDYGMGNLHSVASALQHIAPTTEVRITSDAGEIARADRVIFPGVGAMRDCMGEILKLQLDKTLREQLATGKPVLAICVGMQALVSGSDENGGVSCLNILPGQVKSFSDDQNFQQVNRDKTASNRLKVPHMGWNQVTQTLPHPLWNDIADGSRFYFVHSYFVSSPDNAAIAGRCHHGIDFIAAFARNNLFATQFHPEKSHESGLQLLKNFVGWDGRF